MDFLLINGNGNAPSVPEITVEQVADSATAKVSWAECPGSRKYIVSEGTETGVYTKETEINAADGLCEYTSEDYDDGTEVFFVVKSVGANGVQSAASTEDSVTIDAYIVVALEFDITAPVKAANSAAAAVDAGADYEVADTAWKDDAENPLTLGDPFAAETVYHAVVQLTAKAGHKIADPFTDEDITLPAGATLVSQSVDEDAEENTITIEVSFAATAA